MHRLSMSRSKRVLQRLDRCRRYLPVSISKEKVCSVGYLVVQTNLLFKFEEVSDWILSTVSCENQGFVAVSCSVVHKKRSSALSCDRIQSALWVSLLVFSGNTGSERSVGLCLVPMTIMCDLSKESASKLISKRFPII